MAAAGAKLEFIESRVWEADLQKLHHPEAGDKIRQAITSQVINEREKFGLLDLELLIPGAKIPSWVLFYRRRKKPDLVHLFRVSTNLNKEKERMTWALVVELWEKSL